MKRCGPPNPRLSVSIEAIRARRRRDKARAEKMRLKTQTAALLRIMEIAMLPRSEGQINHIYTIASKAVL